MLKEKIKVKPRKTMRIVYGTGKVPLYWTVRVHDAKKDVVVNGSLMDALTGTPGQTIGCHLSNCAIRNADVFPHECFLAAFTKATCAVVDKIVNGAPTHAVRYVHGYGHLVDLNDTDKERKKIRENPKLAERSFLLRAPKGKAAKGAEHHHPDRRLTRAERRARGWATKDDKPGEKTSKVSIGALARARKAGLVTADLANALSPK